MVVISKATFTHSYAKSRETLTSAINKAKDALEIAAKKGGHPCAFQTMGIDPLSTLFKGKYPFTLFSTCMIYEKDNWYMHVNALFHAMQFIKFV